jgi:hypothetical protein
MTLSFQSHIPKADESRIFQYLMNLDYLFELLHTVKNNLSINIDNESICQVHKTTNWVYQMLKSTLGSALLVYSPPRKAQVEWCTELVQIWQKPCTLPSCSIENLLFKDEF